MKMILNNQLSTLNKIPTIIVIQVTKAGKGHESQLVHLGPKAPQISFKYSSIWCCHNMIRQNT